MVTHAKPLKIAGIDTRILGASARAVDSWLKDADYRAIIKLVPLKAGADVVRLKKEIRIAAVWYVTRIELQALGSTAARQRATFADFADNTQAYLRDVIKAFPPELRPQLRESIGPDEQVQSDPVRARPSPLAIVEAELERLSLRAQKAAQGIPRKSKRTFREARRTMLKAWETATGKSPFADDEAFIAFELALTSRLNVRLNKLKKPTIPAPSRHYMDEARGK